MNGRSADGVEELALSPQEAFKVMTMFLEEFYERTGGDMATLMTDVQLDEDGRTFDPAAWHDWSRIVRQVKQLHKM